MSTNCVLPPELDDQQLLEYRDDPNSHQEIAEHLEKCSFCREKAEALARFQGRLASRLYRSACPSPVELGEYHLGLLPDPQKLVVAQHVRECPYCAQEIEQLAQYLKGMEPSVGFVESIRVVIAQLINQPGAIGLHSSLPALRGERKGPLQFAAEGVIIVLDVEPANDGKTNILGQVAADDQDHWTGAHVELWQGDEILFSTQVDDLGAFSVENIPSGFKELRITPQSSSVMVVSKFEL